MRPGTLDQPLFFARIEQSAVTRRFLREADDDLSARLNGVVSTVARGAR
jgi:hypothetical protein